MIKDESGNRRFYGVYRGIVVDNNDPLDMGRLRLQIPQVLLEEETGWAWATHRAGIANITIPIGAPVWVMFEGGDPSFPMWVGMSKSQITGVPVPITGDLIPDIDNVYKLGTAAKRWKDLQLGPGTLYIEDTVTGAQAGIGVTDGSLTIDGVTRIQMGNMKMNTTGLTFPDGTTQTTAALSGNIRVVSGDVNAVTLDFSVDKIVHVHVNTGTLIVTLANLTAGRDIELLVMYGNTSGAQVNHGITGAYQSSNSSNGASFFLPTKRFSSYKYYCVDGTLANTFVVGQIT